MIKSNLQKFYDLRADEISDPLERLRFFCSLCMNQEDWIEVELFFSDIEAHYIPRKIE